jgi:hypothetical protein
MKPSSKGLGILLEASKPKGSAAEEPEDDEETTQDGEALDEALDAAFDAYKSDDKEGWREAMKAALGLGAEG